MSKLSMSFHLSALTHHIRSSFCFWFHTINVIIFKLSTLDGLVRLGCFDLVVPCLSIWPKSLITLSCCSAMATPPIGSTFSFKYQRYRSLRMVRPSSHSSIWGIAHLEIGSTLFSFKYLRYRSFRMVRIAHFQRI